MLNITNQRNANQNHIMRYHLTPVRMAVIQKEKKKELTSVGEKLEKRVLLYTVGKNVN